jgi:transcriptional regulator with XRE-family HTH domain
MKLMKKKRRLRECRLARNMTVREVAEKLGLHSETYRKYEYLHGPQPGILTAIKMLELFPELAAETLGKKQTKEG